MPEAPAPDRPAFQRRQYELAAHLRDPWAHPPPPDLEERRVAVYRGLLYANIEGLLAGNFPVLRSVLPDPRWHALVRDFFARHRSRTPLFPQVGREFIAYLETERPDASEDPPFLAELAHYEWMELAAALSDADPGEHPADPNGDLMAAAPVLSPLVWVLSYRYPVHRIGPQWQPSEPGEQPTHLLVYRDRQDKVGFVEINPVTLRLIELLKETPPGTGLERMRQITAELAHPRPEAVIDAGRLLLEELRRRDIVLGTAT